MCQASEGILGYIPAVLERSAHLYLSVLYVSSPASSIALYILDNLRTASTRQPTNLLSFSSTNQLVRCMVVSRCKQHEYGNVAMLNVTTIGPIIN